MPPHLDLCLEPTYPLTYSLAGAPSTVPIYSKGIGMDIDVVMPPMIDVDSLINNSEALQQSDSPCPWLLRQDSNRLKSLLSSSMLGDIRDIQKQSELPETSIPPGIGGSKRVPRRPLSPYIFFSQEKRKELKRQHPGWNSGQIMKQVSLLWQRMPPQAKLDFQEQSKKDRERYEMQRHEFAEKKSMSEEQELRSVVDTVRDRMLIKEKMRAERMLQSM